MQPEWWLQWYFFLLPLLPSWPCAPEREGPSAFTPSSLAGAALGNISTAWPSPEQVSSTVRCIALFQVSDLGVFEVLPNWAGRRRPLVGAAVLTGERRPSCHVKLLTALSPPSWGGGRRENPLSEQQKQPKNQVGVGGGGGMGTEFHLLFFPPSSASTDPVTSRSGEKPGPCCLFPSQGYHYYLIVIIISAVLGLHWSATLSTSGAGLVALWHMGSQFPDQGLYPCTLHWVLLV